MRKLKVQEAESGLRADVFVAGQLTGFSRSLISKLFTAGEVSLDGNRLKPGNKLKTGQVVVVDDARLHETPPEVKLPVIYEDENVVVINKPAGVLTHSKGGFNNEATVASFVADKLDGSIPQSNKAGIVHRLDRATSGVIICARNEATQKLLQKQFAQRRTKKIYLAVAEGVLSEQQLIIDAPIARNPKKPQSFTTTLDGKLATTSLTQLSTLVLVNKSKKKIVCTMVELKPTTGRTHQLRVHLRHIGHPVVGDSVYGAKLQDWPQMLLHAASLELTLPGGDRRIFTAPVPGYFP